jgi:hypothetical protein
MALGKSTKFRGGFRMSVDLIRFIIFAAVLVGVIVAALMIKSFRPYLRKSSCWLPSSRHFERLSASRCWWRR